ncbi:MAG TPA: OmpH family outer membrane protein [Candidatus Tectomicrobia bacterium]|nr:OmpH family outer membrane protein [Candidatus Tectomicrobia bacterium]
MKQQTLLKFLLYTGLVGLASATIWDHAWAGQASSSALRVGIVDLDRALKESASGKQAMATLKQFRDKVVKEINDKKRQKDSKENTLRDLQSELTSQSMVLSDSAKRDKEETYRRQVRDLRKFIEDSNRFIEESERDLREREAELTSRLLRDLLTIVRAVGQEESFTIIFERNDRILLFAADAIDLTDKIIKRFDTARR